MKNVLGDSTFHGGTDISQISLKMSSFMFKDEYKSYGFGMK